MDAVIKVGGSLAEAQGVLEALGRELACLAKKHRFVVVPGGGVFADAVRGVEAKLHLSPTVSHRMAILAMDQYGLLLSQIFPDTCTCDSLRVAESASAKGKLAILLPSKLMCKSDPFKPSWDVTSDSIAAYIAARFKAKKIVLVTDVDGIFSANPKLNSEATLLKTISIQKLLAFEERTSVDKYLPRFLQKNPLECYVVNGCFPERIAAVLSGRETVGTQILAGN